MTDDHGHSFFSSLRSPPPTAPQSSRSRCRCASPRAATCAWPGRWTLTSAARRARARPPWWGAAWPLGATPRGGRSAWSRWTRRWVGRCILQAQGVFLRTGATNASVGTPGVCPCLILFANSALCCARRAMRGRAHCRWTSLRRCRPSTLRRARAAPRGAGPPLHRGAAWTWPRPLRAACRAAGRRRAAVAALASRATPRRQGSTLLPASWWVRP